MSESRLADRIRNGSARVTVIGQGYVGLPLAVEFARAGFNTTGLDTDLDRVIALNAGQSYTPDVDSELLKAVIEAGRYEATSDASTDRKSTRLNSSHSQISYAVFCLKKKNSTHRTRPTRAHACLRPQLISDTC